jgi:hypothetical protein
MPWKSIVVSKCFHNAYPQAYIIQIFFDGVFVGETMQQLIPELWTHTPFVGSFLKMNIGLDACVDVPSSVQIGGFGVVS